MKAYDHYRRDSDGVVFDARDVYFLQGVDGGLVKIGVAACVYRRLQVIQAACPITLRLLAVDHMVGIQGERHWHQMFAASRAHHEWFRPNVLLMAVIGEVAERPRNRARLRSLLRDAERDGCAVEAGWLPATTV